MGSFNFIKVFTTPDDEMLPYLGRKKHHPRHHHQAEDEDTDDHQTKACKSFMRAVVRQAVSDLLTRPRETWGFWEEELIRDYNAVIENKELGAVARMRETNRINQLEELLEFSKAAWNWLESDSDEVFSYRWIAEYLGLPFDLHLRLDALQDGAHYMQIKSASRHRVESGARNHSYAPRRMRQSA